MAKIISIGEALSSCKQKTAAPRELFWTCKKCGEIAPLFVPVGLSGRWVKRSCKCQILEREKREREEIRQAWLKDQRVRTFGGWMGSQYINKALIQEMCGKTFDNYDGSLQFEAYDKAITFAKNPRGNLLFYGSYGTGKTHLEAAICNRLREVGVRGEDGKLQPMSSIFVSAPQFFMAYEETRRSLDQTDHIRLMQQVTNTPLLVFDDIDKSRPTDARWEIYWHIFDMRCTAKKPTILSTNKRSELENYIGGASLSRLSRGLVAIEMIGDDFRREED